MQFYTGKEFANYQNCFTDTFRNKVWTKIPSNTLADGDIIRLLPGDMAQADKQIWSQNQQINYPIAPAYIRRVEMIKNHKMHRYER